MKWLMIFLLGLAIFIWALNTPGEQLWAAAIGGGLMGTALGSVD